VNIIYGSKIAMHWIAWPILTSKNIQNTRIVHMPSYYKTKCSFSYNIIFLFKQKKCLSGLYALIESFTFANETEDEKYTKKFDESSHYYKLF